jgi:hypothetical protein
MHLRRHLLTSTAVLFALASCAVPTAGTRPSGAPASVTPAAWPIGPAVPAQTAAPKVAPVAVPSLPPAPPIADAARLRLTGSVVFADQPIANASLTAIDLATGRAITLDAWSETPGRGATGTQRTDAKGAFDVELPELRDGQIVRLTATTGSQTFTALFDARARARAVGAAGAQGESYRLQQGQAASITFLLRLTPASTAAAKAFEGALKLTFQLPKGAQQAERDRALAAAEQAAKEVEAALAKRPELADDLVVSVGPDGEVRDLDAFRSTVARLGVFDQVFEAVQARLEALSARQLTAEGALDPVTAEDFPLDRVAITPGGGLVFTGGRSALGGDPGAHFLPTPARRTRRDAGGNVPIRVEPAVFTLPFTPTALAFLRGGLGLLLGTDNPSGPSLHRLVPPGPSLPEAGSRRGQTTGIAQSLDTASDRVVVVGITETGQEAFTYTVAADGTASTDVSLTQAGLLRPQAAAGRSRFYVLESGIQAFNDTRVRWYDQLTPTTSSGTLRVGGSDWHPLATALSASQDGAMTVWDADAATPTVLVANMNTVHLGQDGGTARAIQLPQRVIGLAIASPTLYVTYAFDRVVAVDLRDPQASSTVVSSQFGSGAVRFDWFQPLKGLALDGPTSPTTLYVGGFDNKVYRVPLPR